MKADFMAHRRDDGEEQSVSSHLKGVAAMAKRFAEKVGCADAGELIGLIHDFGKYSQAFQAYIGSATGVINPDEDEYVDFKGKKGKIDHSTAGAQCVWQALSRCGKNGQGELCGQILALCIASHHSGLIDCLDAEGRATFVKRIEKSDEETHLKECLEKANKDILEQVDVLAGKELVKKMYLKLQQLVAMPTSSAESLSQVDFFTLGLFTRFLFSCLVDADRLNSAEFEDPAREQSRLAAENAHDWSVAIDRLEEKLDSFECLEPIDTIRRNIADQCKYRSCDAQGIYTLTVPTGGGKTLASLRYALHHAFEHSLERIIYIIPYTSIIEQNAGDVRDILERQGDEFSWVLEHHSNVEPEYQTWHSKLVAENWDVPIVFTTMVQFLEALFGSGTRSVRRMHQLANSVLIFDEIQTLPINCTHLFCNALNFLTQHAGTTAVMCTATQPLLDQLHTPENGQLALAENSEIVGEEYKYTLFHQLERVKVRNQCKVGGWTEDEICELILQRFSDSRSCLVVVNTKEWAQRLVLACEKHVESHALFHLSTNQYPAHRKRLLDAIKERLQSGDPVLCVSTQLIEAGVNVSFASAIRFIAGLDSIAQAAGRCNRHGELKDTEGRRIKGYVDIINPAEEKIACLQDITIGQEKTRRILGEFEESLLLTPDTMTRYFQYYFFERSDAMTYPLSARYTARDDTLLNMLGTNILNGGNVNARRAAAQKLPLLQQSFMTAAKAFKAIDAPTHTVLIPHGEGEALVTKLCALAVAFDAPAYYKALKQAQKYSVNVFPYIWQKLVERDAICETQEGEGIYYLQSEYYSDTFGLSTEPVKSSPALVC